MNFYTYLYLDPKDQTPIYVGKGKNNRAYSHFEFKSHLGRLLRKRLKEGFNCKPLFLNKDCSETQAFAYERFWIAVYGRKDKNRGTLLNQTDGGDGTSGLIHSEETKLKISVSSNNRSIQSREKISAANRNRSPEVKLTIAKKVSESLKGHKHSKETKQKMSDSAKLRKSSNETKAKISAANRNRSPEVKLKISKSMIGHYVSADTKAKISASRKSSNL